MSNDIFDTPIIQYIDYLWLNYSSIIMAYNSIYVVFPFAILGALALTEEDLHDNAVLALIFCAFPLSIEIF